MKKYYCPYCGEKVLNFNQKFNRKRTITPFSKTTNELWFSCSNCGNDVEHKATLKSKKIYNILIPIYLVLALLFFVLAVIKQYVFMLMILAFICAITIIISLIGYKYDVFVRKGVYTDKLFNIKLDTENNSLFYEQVIYTVKPLKEDIHKNIESVYIVAFSNFSDTYNTCKVRFIKPKNAFPFILNCKKFEIYDEFKLIGKGEIL